MVREALGCVRRGGLSSPAYNHSVGYTCPRGRLLAQNTSHAAKGIVFEQVIQIVLFVASQHGLYLPTWQATRSEHVARGKRNRLRAGDRHNGDATGRQRSQMATPQEGYAHKWQRQFLSTE
jgi:hypothetical protein